MIKLKIELYFLVMVKCGLWKIQQLEVGRELQRVEIPWASEQKCYTLCVAGAFVVNFLASYRPSGKVKFCAFVLNGTKIL